MYIQKEILL